MSEIGDLHFIFIFYEGSFVLKLNDSEAEAAETQTWLDFALKCEYINQEEHRDLYQSYDQILGKLVNMINSPTGWLMTGKK